MKPEHDIPIRRRPDGSIDIAFYADRAGRLRRTALREEPARWVNHLSRAIAKLAAAHMPDLSRRGR